MNASEFYYLSGIEKVAAKNVYKKFGIVRNELNILASLSGFLMLHGRNIVGRDIFTDWLGLNYRMERKVFYYLKSLVDKGCLYRLAYRRPDGNCLAISPYGEQILIAFERELTAIQAKDKLKNPNFRSLQIDLDNLPKGYILKESGRKS